MSFAQRGLPHARELRRLVDRLNSASDERTHAVCGGAFEQRQGLGSGRRQVELRDPGEEIAHHRVDVDALLDPVRPFFRDEALHLWFLRQRAKGLHEAAPRAVAVIRIELHLSHLELPVLCFEFSNAHSKRARMSLFPHCIPRFDLSSSALLDFCTQLRLAQNSDA